MTIPILGRTEPFAAGGDAVTRHVLGTLEEKVFVGDEAIAVLELSRPAPASTASRTARPGSPKPWLDKRLARLGIRSGSDLT